jgi:Flp pilus assembly protein TadD
LRTGYIGRAIARYDRHDLQGAISDFSKVIDLNPRSARAYGSRGLVRLQLGQETEAEQDFEVCSKLDPGFRPKLEQSIQVIRRERAAKR